MTALRGFGGMALALVATGCGCTAVGSARGFDPAELDARSGWIAVRGVPFLHEAGEADSGTAALGMIFAYWGVEGWPRERIERSCPVIGGRGTRARDLRSCAREAGLEAHLIHGTWEDLVTELRAGRPVVVGLLKSYRAGKDPHYEVLVALHADDRTVVTLDPRHGWRQNSLHGFLTEWEGTTGLLLVFSAPGRDTAGARGSPP